MPDDCVVAVASGKGGVGKTTTSINVAAALASAGRSVAIAELDLAMANVVDFLRLDVDPEVDPTIHEVLSGGASVADATYETPVGFDVLPSGVSLDGFADTDPNDIAMLVRFLRDTYDNVILDTGAGISRESMLPLALADQVVLVSTPRAASVRDTKKTRQVTERVGGSVAGIVFSMSGTGNAPEVEDIADFLGLELLGHVPDDDAVPASQDVGLPVVTYAPNSPAAEAYRDIAVRVDMLSQDRKVAGDGVPS